MHHYLHRIQPHHKIYSNIFLNFLVFTVVSWRWQAQTLTLHGHPRFCSAVNLLPRCYWELGGWSSPGAWTPWAQPIPWHPLPAGRAFWVGRWLVPRFGWQWEIRTSSYSAKSARTSVRAPEDVERARLVPPLVLSGGPLWCWSQRPFHRKVPRAVCRTSPLLPTGQPWFSLALLRLVREKEIRVWCDVNADSCSRNTLWYQAKL